MDFNRGLFIWPISSCAKRLANFSKNYYKQDDRLLIDLVFYMREYIEVNLKVIRKYLKKRKKFISKLNNDSILEEFKEWSKDPLPEKELIWTLPDLTSNARLKNFCRSIKKEIR